MRLTHDVKSSIKVTLMKATFDKELESLNIEEHALAKRVLESVIDKKTLDVLRKAPENFVRRGTDIGMDVPGRRWIRLAYETEDLSSHTSVQLNETMIKEVSAFLDKKDEYEKRQREAARKLYAVMNSVTTTKRLVETWPDLAPYVPADSETIYPIAIRAEELNATFGLPV